MKRKFVKILETHMEYWPEKLQQEALHFDRYCMANYLRGGSFAMKFRGKVCSRTNKKVEIALTHCKNLSRRSSTWMRFVLKQFCISIQFSKSKLDIYTLQLILLLWTKTKVYLLTRFKTHGSNEKSGKYDRCEFKLTESVRCCRKSESWQKAVSPLFSWMHSCVQHCFAFSITFHIYHFKRLWN